MRAHMIGGITMNVHIVAVHGCESLILQRPEAREASVGHTHASAPKSSNISKTRADIEKFHRVKVAQNSILRRKTKKN